MKKMMIRILLVLTLVTSTNVIAQEKLHIEGSTTVGPIADGFAEVFKKLYPDVAITVNKSGSGTGASALIDGRCDIATMSRFMKDEEFKNAVDKGVFPVAHAIAMDGVCVVLHPSNPISALTTEQVRDIYTGKIKNWKDLGGPDMSIVDISRDTSSGTYETFESFVMNKEKMAPNVEQVSTNAQMFARVESTRAAIGYVGYGFVKTGVKAVTLNKIKPTVQTILNGQYPVSRPLYMFTNGYPKLGSMTHKFISFYLTEEGQEVIEDKGFVPVTNY